MQILISCPQCSSLFRLPSESVLKVKFFLFVVILQTITLWTPETNEMRKTLALPYPEEEIK